MVNLALIEESMKRPTVNEQTDKIFMKEKLQTHALNNEDIVRNALMNKNIIQEGTKPYKLRPEAIAAIMGNIATENSKFITNQEEIGDINTLKNNQRGYGLFQFTDYRDAKTGEIVGHRTAYNKYLNNSNKKDSAQSQVDYVLANIFNGEGHDIGAGNRTNLVGTITNGSVEEITDLFAKVWERPKNLNSKKRIKKAQEFYMQLMDIK